MELLPDLSREKTAPEEVTPGISPLEFLRAIYRDPSQPMERRMRAAIEATKYDHPRLAVVASVNADGFAAKLEAAIARSRRGTTLDALPVATIEARSSDEAC